MRIHWCNWSSRSNQPPNSKLYDPSFSVSMLPDFQESELRMSGNGDLMAELTEAQLFELRDAFKLYEEQSEAGKVDLQELGRLLR